MPADTSEGVVLLRSMGDAPCLLGKTWGYDQISVWVSEGCGGVFALGETGLARRRPGGARESRGAYPKPGASSIPGTAS